MIVVLDTNILCKDFYMRGTQLMLLRQLGGIVIPEISFDEALNKHREKMRECGSALSKRAEEYQRMTLLPLQVDVEGNYEEEDRQYEEFLTGVLIENNSYPPEPYPELSHKDVVQRSLQRKKPFKSDGREGYRDYLVWRSVLEVVKHSSDEVHFISENQKDFANEQNKNELHPELIEEMEQLDIDKTKLHYWGLLKDFIDEVVKPKLSTIDEEQVLIDRLSSDKQNFLNPLKARVLEKLIGFDVLQYNVYVPGDDPAINSIDDYHEMEIDQVSQLQEEKFLVSIQAKYMGEIKSHVTKAELSTFPPDYLADSATEEIDAKNLAIYTMVLLDVEIEVIFDFKTESICSVDITDVSDSTYCEYCPYD